MRRDLADLAHEARWRSAIVLCANETRATSMPGCDERLEDLRAARGGADRGDDPGAAALAASPPSVGTDVFEEGE